MLVLKAVRFTMLTVLTCTVSLMLSLAGCPMYLTVTDTESCSLVCSYITDMLVADEPEVLTHGHTGHKSLDTALLIDGCHHFKCRLIATQMIAINN